MLKTKVDRYNSVKLSARGRDDQSQSAFDLSCPMVGAKVVPAAVFFWLLSSRRIKQPTGISSEPFILDVRGLGDAKHKCYKAATSVTLNGDQLQAC